MVPRILLAAVGLGLGGRAAAADDQPLAADALLDPTHLVEVRITLKDADWEALRHQARHAGSFYAGAPIDDPYTWFKADLRLDGVRIKGVAVRKKGLFGSSDVERPSLKIKFDEFVDQDPVAGLNRLTLNNNKQDTSLVSQYLSYQVFRDAGLPAPRSNFARVVVNNEDLGIYTHVESIKKPFLARAFGDDSGNLYEGLLNDFHERTLAKLDKKTNQKADDRTDVARIAALFAGDAPLDLAAVADVIDLDGFLRFWAIEALIAFWDGYSANQNNYYFYVHPTTGRGWFIPWGADACFAERSAFGGADTAVHAQSILCNRLFHVDGIPDRYRDAMRQVLDEAWREDDLIAEIDRIEKLVRTKLHDEQKDMAEAMDRVRAFVQGRRRTIEGALDRWPATVPPEPVAPTYTVPLGTVKGTFTTRFDDKEPDQPTRVGDVTLEGTFKDAPLVLRRVGASAFEYRRPGPAFGPGRNAPPRVDVCIAGARESDGVEMRLTVSIDEAAFLAASGDPVPVSGSYREGDEAPRNPFAPGAGPNRSVYGHLTLDKAGVQRGQRVQGTFELTIAEVHGTFGRRRRGQQAED